MEAGLKILVSAVQSRPCPPFFFKCPSENFSRAEFVPRFVPNSRTLWSIPAHEGAKDVMNSSTQCLNYLRQGG